MYRYALRHECIVLKYERAAFLTIAGTTEYSEDKKMFDGYTMAVLEQRIGYCFHNKALLKPGRCRTGAGIQRLPVSGTPGCSGGRADQDARLHGVRAFPGILCQRPGAGTVYAFG